MEKLSLWFSPNSIRFQLQKYDCIIAKKVFILASEIKKNKVIIHKIEGRNIFNCKEFDNNQVYWVFTTNQNYNLN